MKRFAPENGKSKPAKGEHYRLRLYITGASARSARAIRNIKVFCEEYLGGRYSLEIIDIYQNPVLAKGEQILAAPTLIRYLPPPVRRFIGDMSRTEKLLLGMDLRREPDDENQDESSTLAARRS